MLDARELLLDPRACSRSCAARLGLRFDAAMLRWQRRTAARGRRVGAALVRQRAPLDRLRALPAEDAPVPGRPAAAARGVPAALRAPRLPRLRARSPRAAPRATRMTAARSPTRATRPPGPRRRPPGRRAREAKVSVFDSSVQGGDACWEGLRVYDGRVFALDAHLDRLFASARALAFEQRAARDRGRAAIFDCLRGQRHARRRARPAHADARREGHLGHEPALNQSGPCLIVLAEWKPPVYGNARPAPGHLVVRRNPPQCLDSQDPPQQPAQQHPGQDRGQRRRRRRRGHARRRTASSPRPTRRNLFLVARGELHTPRADHCLPGITRAIVLELARGAASRARERPSRWPSSTPPTRCSRPARWASSRRSSRSTAGVSARARSARSPSACGSCSRSGPRSTAGSFPSTGREG